MKRLVLGTLVLLATVVGGTGLTPREAGAALATCRSEAWAKYTACVESTGSRLVHSACDAEYLVRVLACSGPET